MYFKSLWNTLILTLTFILGTSAVLAVGDTARGAVVTNVEDKNWIGPEIKVPEIPFSEAVQRKRSGLEFDSQDERDQVYRTFEYFKKFGRSRSGRLKLRAQCQRARQTNYFCRSNESELDLDKGGGRNAGGLRSRSLLGGHNRLRAHELKDLILSHQWEKLSRLSEAQLIIAAQGIRSRDAVIKLGNEILGVAQASQGLKIGIASQLEEYLPEPQVFQMIEKLYVEAASGDVTESGARGAYRGALFLISENKFKEAQDVLARYSEARVAEAYFGRMRYWRLYCALQTKDTSLSESLQRQVERESPLSFHGLLGSNQKLRERLHLNHPTPLVQLRSRLVPELNNTLRILEVLAENNMGRDVASRYIEEAVDLGIGAEAAVKAYLAVVLDRFEDGLGKFKVLTALFRQNIDFVTNETLPLYFPTWHLDALKRISEDSSVDPYLILSIIRQESAFNQFAKSQAGARGLLQLMPATARRLSRVRAQELFKPEVNMKVGSRFFSNLLGRFDSNIIFALAAYNAGPNRVVEWMSRYPTQNPLLFTDFIPYRETREYVANILRNYYWYTELYRETNELKTEPPVQAPEGGRAIANVAETRRFKNSTIQETLMAVPGGVDLLKDVERAR